MSQEQSRPDVVYVLLNPAMPGYVKIGITEDLASRMKQLFTTPVPVPFSCFYAARVENAARVETQLLEIFGDKRSHPNREFFEVEPHRVAAAIKLAEIEDVTASATSDDSASKEDSESFNRAVNRADRFNFEMLNIPVGSELYFYKDYDITCTVVSRKPPRVEFRGVEMSLSKASQEANASWATDGLRYWEYEKGETLQERRTRMENAESNGT